MTRLAVALAVLIAMSGCPAKATCPTTGPSASEPDSLTEALRAVEEWRAAWETRGVETIMGLYDHGPTVTLVTQGTAVVGWDLVQSELQQRLSRATAIHFGLSDIRVAPTGSSAIVTASLNREIAEGATTASDAGTLTLVLHRDGTRWIVLAEHFSFRPRP